MTTPKYPNASAEQMAHYLADMTEAGEEIADRLGIHPEDFAGPMYSAGRTSRMGESDPSERDGIDEFHAMLLHCSQLAELSRPENGMPLDGQEVPFLTSAAWVALCATKMLAWCKE